MTLTLSLSLPLPLSLSLLLLMFSLTLALIILIFSMVLHNSPKIENGTNCEVANSKVMRQMRIILYKPFYNIYVEM